MLVCARELLSYRTKTKDGYLGKICDFYFDGDLWTINYLVIEIQSKLYINRMPISTTAITSVNQEEQIFYLDVTRSQMETAPSCGEQVLMSRQKEVELHHHYQWSAYWLTRWVVQKDGNDTLYYHSTPVVMAEEIINQATAIFLAEDPSLQSMSTLFNCTFTITTGHRATVIDVLVNLRNWRITNLIFARQSALQLNSELHSPPIMGTNGTNGKHSEQKSPLA